MTSQRSPRTLLRALLLTAVMFVAFAYPSAASADTLYAATGGSNTGASLYTLNPTTAVPTLVGPIEVSGIQQTNITGLASDPTDSGALYGFMNSPTNDRSDPTFEDGTLLTIDKTNGDAEVVGSIGAAGPLRASDITFDRFGNLYAWSGGCSGTDNCNSNGSDLYTLDTTTGTSTKVSESGTEGFQTGLASDSQGRMYMKSFEGLFRVNPFTGHVFSAIRLTQSSRNVASFGPGDTLYTGSFNPFSLQTLNTSTGALTTIGSTGLSNVSAIDWDFTSPTAPATADLRLDSSVTDSAPTAGTDVTFTLSLVNDGPDSATGVMVKDLLPSGFTYVSHTASTGTYVPGTGIWNLGTVANAAAPTLAIVATVLSTGVHTNPAEVAETTSYDDDSTPGSGQGDTFDSTRSAPAAASTLYAATGSGSGFCGGSPSSLYELDPLTGAPAKVADITIGGAPVTHVTGLGVNPGDGTLWGFMNFQGSDCDLSSQSGGTLITINKTTGAASIVGSEGATEIQSPDMTFDPFGDLFAWGEGNAAGTENDDLYELDTTTGTSLMVGECVCSTNSTGLASDSLGRMYVKTNALNRVNQFTGRLFSPVFLSQNTHNMLAFGPSDAVYTGRRDEPNQYEFSLKTINPSNGAVTVVGTNSVWTIAALAWDLPGLTAPNQVDLSLTKTSDITSPDDWTDQVTFTVTLTNHDLTESATGVKVKDLLPSGLTYVSDTPSTGSYDSGTGIWNVGTVAADDSETLVLVVTSNPNSSARTNVAEVVESTTYDPDSVPGSGDTTGDTRASKTITPTANPAVDGAADVVVNGPSRTTATSKGFTVLIKNVGTGVFTTSTGDLDVTVNGNSGVVTCKPFSATVKPGRQTRAQCSANLDALPLSVGNNVAYSATLNLSGDGFTGNDTNTENRTAS